ncbi:hypothetical protein [Nocardia sp. alder85J]|uniref:hypothetical protein n=1 Tax=Nocardia sp. alder85J TaxID=2862949 RepID=UPI001CD4E76F|nr:hypothetical protein [Nocardia sp. alder85J]MCX4091161.1 hypothetical protein [Nocardia sp. alder85J]
MSRGSGRIAWKVTAQRASLGVMLMVSVTTLASACGSGDTGSATPSPSTTTRQLAAVPAPDPSTSDGVAVAALREVYTWYPATEAPGASLGRARKWLGPSLIRTLDTPPTGIETPKPSLQWADWGAAGAHVEAFTFASGEKAPTTDPDHEQYKIGIEQTVVYPDGRREPLPPATVIATVVHTADGWRLDGFR